MCSLTALNGGQFGGEGGGDGGVTQFDDLHLIVFEFPQDLTYPFL